MAAGRRRHVLVFARDPVPGRVKTRLIPDLGATAATELYRVLLGISLAAAAAVRADDRTLWLDRAGPQAATVALASAHGMRLAVQRGADLGARMATALDQALAAGASAVLIGSDCAQYDAAYLESAFLALERHDAVLGPAVDGGYVLIGLRRSAPGLFQGVDWSTSAVMQQTRERLRRLGWDWHELPTLRDLDTAPDLLHFPQLRAGVACLDRGDDEGSRGGC